MSLSSALCLLLVGFLPLPAFVQGQELNFLPPCGDVTNRWEVTSSAGAAALASALECSNGDFAVEWEGTVVVSETIQVFDGTSLAITGGEQGGATMDGDHTTQLISLSGGSTVRLTNMTLANASSASDGGAIYVGESSRVVLSGSNSFTANAAAKSGGALMVEESSEVSWDSGEVYFIDNISSDLGGAVFVDDGSSISWTGDATFTGNAANYGGAMHVSGLSTASWGGNTNISGNSAYSSGGGIMADGLSDLSWEGDTVLSNNSATYWGGAVYMKNSTISWSGNTTISDNSARDGGGMFFYEYVAGSWTGQTTFERNTASWTAGALDVHTYSKVAWNGTTTFEHNTADRGGAMFVWLSEVAWTAGNTTFAHNIAVDDGGALYATLNHVIECNDHTVFWNNTAAEGDGGALGLYGSGASGSSVVNISGDVTFTSNTAFGNGGGVFSSANTAGQHFENVTFQYNSASVGGAVATFGTGNGDESTPAPARFVRCRFLSNSAAETGGGVECAFGQEEFTSSHFEDNFADIGGALRLGGKTTIDDCAFVANSASTRGPAIAAVAFVAINNTVFDDNTFFCQAGEYVEDVKKVVDDGRYKTVCFDCPERSECNNCTVRESDGQPTCSIALDNTVSEHAGASLETLNVSRGYWRSSNLSVLVLACYNPKACLGGQTGVDDPCNDGYRGPYCAVCESGYASSLAHTCTRCSGSRRDGLVAAAVIVGTAALCVLVAFCAYLLSAETGERRRGCIHQSVSAKFPLQSLKIIIVVWQILTQFASAANISFPDIYQDFINALDVVNFDLGSLVVSGCWSDINIDFHDRLLVTTLGPLVVVGGLASTYAVAMRRNSASGGCRQGAETIRHKHLSALLLLTFLVYSSVSATVFQMFACDELDDGYEYLRSDYRILCTDAKHEALQVYAAFMIALYPVGIPLLYAVLLHHRRDVLADPRADKATAQSIADLWDPYRAERFYYEVIDRGRRGVLRLEQGAASLGAFGTISE
eukprot:g7691.t1